MTAACSIVLVDWIQGETAYLSLRNSGVCLMTAKNQHVRGPLGPLPSLLKVDFIKVDLNGARLAVSLHLLVLMPGLVKKLLPVASFLTDRH